VAPYLAFRDFQPQFHYACSGLSKRTIRSTKAGNKLHFIPFNRSIPVQVPHMPFARTLLSGYSYRSDSLYLSLQAKKETQI
jgi:hypothetical protein